uniref:Uncharacterized protein n=1 Tax=Cacopsylla melanoneura TaxID=428564 RepID=A0A8D8QZ94_9HEMI
MENKTEISGAGIYGVDKGMINFKLGPKFALTYGKSRLNVLYLRYKAFCSFMDHTTKRNLLVPNHGIMTFQPDGTPKGYLTFDIVPLNDWISPSFWLGRFDLNFKICDAQSVTFKQNSTSEKKKNQVNTANKSYLKLKNGDDLLYKMQFIQSEVFEDPGLVTEIYELTRKLNNNTMQNLLRKPTIGDRILNALCFRWFRPA